MVLAVTNPNNVKVYQVGSDSQTKKLATSSASSINHLNVNFLSKSRSSRNKKANLRTSPAYADLIQDFAFPEACFRIQLTPDGRHAMATGTYKPHFRVFDLAELSMKFCRHSSADNVQFRFLSSDWTKTMHLQSDRSIEFHTSMGLHYSVRIPHFGRALEYCESTCEALVGTSSSNVYRLDLCQGQFKAPLVSASPAIEAVSVNPVHQLWTFGGTDGFLEAWDPRCKSQLHRFQVSSHSLTCLSQRTDGLTMAVGDAQGVVRLFDLRHAQPMVTQSHPYATEIHALQFHDRSEHVVSSDRHSVRFWERTSGTLLTTLEAQAPINDVCVVPDSGLVFLATEAPQLGTYFLPALGTAPSFCSFLDTLVGEEETAGTRSIASQPTTYQEGKFVSQEEMEKLELTEYIGTPHVKAYMHGYFVPWSMYKRAVSIVNPFAYEEYQAQLKKAKLEALTASRILPLVKQKRQHQQQATLPTSAESKGAKKTSQKPKDSRFSVMFEDPDFAIDETSAEFKRIYTSGKALSTQKHQGQNKDNTNEDLDSDEEALLERGYLPFTRPLSTTNDSDAESSSASDSETTTMESFSKPLSFHKKIDSILQQRKPTTSAPSITPSPSTQNPVWERVHTKDEASKLKRLPFALRIEKEKASSEVNRTRIGAIGGMQMTFQLGDTESKKKGASFKRKRTGRVR